jgi:cytochrome c biogenesis protein
VAGLVTSLYVNRRRVWVRTGTHSDGRTMVEYGLLARGEDHRLAGEAAAIRKLLAGQWQLSGEDPSAAPDGASPEHTEADSIQSTAGSHESKKDQ